MRISHSSYSNYIAKLSKEIEQKSLYSPLLLNNETLLFPFSENPKESIVISLNNRCPLFYKTSNDLFFSSFENSFLKEYRKHYGRAVISNLVLSKDDFVIYFDLCIEETNEVINVIVELIPCTPNLIIVKENHIQKSFYKYKDRDFSFDAIFEPLKTDQKIDGEQEIHDQFLTDHFSNEIVQRNKEKYSEFTSFLNSKIKAINKKINAIQNDVKNADEMLTLNEKADNIFTLGLDLKSRVESLDLYGEIIKLDPSKTILENCQNFYKKSKKAKETISRAETNLNNAKNELLNFESIKQDFESRDERGKDELILMYKPNKKHEVKATEMNRPWKYNLNGTYIYFGRNASQNDYLSFVMKNDRDFTWLHIKDKSGAHLIIASKKPTENELLFACEFALICSHCKAGEIVYTKKKSVRKGHVLGEAILKNYQTIKLNNVRESTLKAFEDIKRCN